LVIVADELEADRPTDVTWLLHTKEESALRPPSQSLTVVRDHLRMRIHLAASAAPLRFEQTDQWPVPPKQGYPMVTRADPPRQWHFRASTTSTQAAHRLAAVMIVGDDAHMPTHHVTRSNGSVTVEADLEQGQVVAHIQLQDRKSAHTPFLNVRFVSDDGQPERVLVP
jgi:hypothetical protein